ncbi:hypothetical protein [Bosea sp. (in: a-proteobacteria)]|uniref:hypothetical protein n=1 Tax=Bosea sp. (in: a-proteobacteria) TaxID=1871050 RepID=UPI002732CC07|nr:hypothetical protein [Bosea sp. (in: a-proteobacteria)]MDP3408064.1 hypothetical protein [Bosea sp. (in: a-proteobacteria)]
MATIAKKSGLAAVKKSTATAARRLGGVPEKPERNAAVVADVRSGMKQAAVAAKHGISRPRVSKILRNALKAAATAPAPTEKVERNAAIAAEALAGDRLIDVAAKHGVSPERVRQIVKRVAPNYAARPRGETLRQAIVADAATMTTKQIAAKHGVTIDYVQTVRRLAGVAVPKPVKKPVEPRVSAKDLRAERDRKILFEVAAGAMHKEVAARHGIDDSRVAQIVRRDAPHLSRISKIEIRDEAIVADAKAGLTRAQMAERHGITKDRITDIISRAGVKARVPTRTKKPGTLVAQAIKLAPTHTPSQIAEILGSTRAVITAALHRVGVKAIDGRTLYAAERRRKLTQTPPSVPEIAATAVATELARPFVPLPEPLAVARVVNNFGRDEAVERWGYVSPATLESLLAEGRKIIADEMARLKADDDLLPKPSSVEVFVKPSAAYVAETVAHHGMEAARTRWPFLPTDELFELNREGSRLISPPADEPLQPLGVRVWRAIKRLFGRS